MALKAVETVAKKLTDKELESKSKELAENVGKLETMRTKHADQKAGMRGREKAMRESIVELALSVETGTVRIPAQVDIDDQ